MFSLKQAYSEICVSQTEQGETVGRVRNLNGYGKSGSALNRYTIHTFTEGN